MEYVRCAIALGGCSSAPCRSTGPNRAGAPKKGLKMIRLLLFLIVVCAPAAEMTIAPALITRCISGVGQATISWSNAGPGLVQVRLFQASGPPITGWEPSEGSAVTGPWVEGQMVFVLVDEGGTELARVVARVSCNAVVDPPSNPSYWPLAAGNRWVFRVDNRLSASDYEHWRVIDNVVTSDRIYTRVQAGGEEWLLREDEHGRLWRMFPSGAEELWMDPNQPSSPDAVLKPGYRGPVSLLIGDFTNAIRFDHAPDALIFETIDFVQGLGPARIDQTMMSGSSGGFLKSGRLVEAFINGRLWTRPGVRVQLLAESTTLHVSGKSVTNCAVPCYFAACGLVPGADPPGTYKPCFETSVAAEGAPLDAEALLELVNSAGTPVLSQQLPLGLDGAFHYQAPLFTTPNMPFLQGDYVLRVRVRDGLGAEIGSASLALRID